MWTGWTVACAHLSGPIGVSLEGTNTAHQQVNKEVLWENKLRLCSLLLGH